MRGNPSIAPPSLLFTVYIKQIICISIIIRISTYLRYTALYTVFKYTIWTIECFGIFVTNVYVFNIMYTLYYTNTIIYDCNIIQIFNITCLLYLFIEFMYTIIYTPFVLVYKYKCQLQLLNLAKRLFFLLFTLIIYYVH